MGSAEVLTGVCESTILAVDGPSLPLNHEFIRELHLTSVKGVLLTIAHPHKMYGTLCRGRVASFLPEAGLRVIPVCAAWARGRKAIFGTWPPASERAGREWPITAAHPCIMHGWTLGPGSFAEQVALAGELNAHRGHAADQRSAKVGCIN